MKNLFIALTFIFVLLVIIKQETRINTLEKGYSEVSLRLQEQELVDQIGKEMIYSKLNIRDLQ